MNCAPKTPATSGRAPDVVTPTNRGAAPLAGKAQT